ncbi:MAG: glycine--tRNA ligase [Patescibacteria group bacterium]
MQQHDKDIQTIITYAKSKGFVFQGSEIYDGLSGVYDYGPRGAILMQQIREAFRATWRTRRDFYEIDSAIFKHPKTWEASGHTAGFSDPLAECKECQARIRVDKALEEIGIEADEKMSEEELNTLFDAHREEIPCPQCGKHNFTSVRAFNLLVQSNLGNFTTQDTSHPVYLPGEAAQGIYLNYKNVVDSMHPKIPFGIAQIGKAFRNEISPRKFLFRTREFEQADTQYFIRLGESKDYYERIKEERMNWYLQLGISENHLRWKQHDNLVFYAADAWDIEYDFPSYGFDEIEGVHDRTDYDLRQHSAYSGVDLSFNDDGDKFIPHIIETSMGLGRVFLALLCEAYDEEVLSDGEKRVVMHFSPKLAPEQVAVLPLMKKDGLAERALELYKLLAPSVRAGYSDSGTIGKRYRRADEIGTPFCVTVDHDTLEEGTVTIRERDSMKQERINIDELEEYVKIRLT